MKPAHLVPVDHDFFIDDLTAYLRRGPHALEPDTAIRCETAAVDGRSRPRGLALAV